MSFHEKSAWACLVALGVVYVPYFLVVLRSPLAGLGLFWLATAGLAAILVVFHTVNALATKSIRSRGDVPPTDELDQSIELRAAKWAGFALSFAVVTWILFAMYATPAIGGREWEQAKQAGTDLSPAHFSIPALTALAAVHWLFAGFVVANVVYYGGIVVRYRSIAGA